MSRRQEGADTQVLHLFYLLCHIPQLTSSHSCSRAKDEPLARAFLTKHTLRDVSVHGRLELCSQMQWLLTGHVAGLQGQGAHSSFHSDP